MAFTRCNLGVPRCVVRHENDPGVLYAERRHRNAEGQTLTQGGWLVGSPGEAPPLPPFGLDADSLARLAALGWSAKEVADAWTQIANAWGWSPITTPPGYTESLRRDLGLDTESGVWFNGGTEGRPTPREKETNMTKIDQVALDVIDALLREDGDFERDPGQVLFGLAEATGHDYKACSLAVLYLETMGFVEVERRDAPEAHKANRLIKIRLL